MATFTKLPSGKWRVQVRKKGVYKAASFATKREALAWSTEIEAQANHVAAGGYAPVPKTATLADLIDKYKEHFTRELRENKAACLSRLHRDIGATKLSDLTASVLRDFIDRRHDQGAGGGAIAADLSYLSSVLKWGKFARQLDLPERLALDARASLKHRGLDPHSKERSREPTDDELTRLYAYWATSKSRTPMETICRLAIATSMRQNEICTLLVEDVDCANKTVVIRDRKDPKSKEGNNQTVPLLPEAWAIVEPLIRGKTQGFIFTCKANNVSANFTRACQSVEPPILDLHFHDLRHKAAASFFRMGLDIPQVALLTGHKTWAMLRRYTRITAADVLGIVNKAVQP